MITEKEIEKIKEHYANACEKHPDFVHNFGIAQYKHYCKVSLAEKREILEYQTQNNEISLSTVLLCEVWEFFEAIADDKITEAIEEGYDIISVVLRAIERIKQKEV